MKNLFLYILIILSLFYFSCQTSTQTAKIETKQEIIENQELIKKATTEYPEYDPKVFKKNPAEFLTIDGIFQSILNQSIVLFNNAVANEDFDLLEQAGYGFFYVYGYTGSNVAKEYLDKIRNFKQKKLAEYANLAQKYEKNKELIMAATFWGKVLKIDPNNKDAKEFFQKNKELIQKEISKYLEDAKKLLSNQKFDDAEKLYKTILLFDPNNQEAKAGIQKVKEEKAKAAQNYFNKGKELFEKKDYTQAQRFFKMALDLGYDRKIIKEYLDKIDYLLNIEKYYQSCIEALNKKDFFTAEDFAKRVINLDPNYKDIKALYERIKKGIEDTLLAWYNQAIELYNQKAYDKALEIFQRIAKYNPNYKDIQNYIQNCMAKLQALSGTSSSSGG